MNTTTINFNNVAYTEADLTNLSGPQLVELYNEVLSTFRNGRATQGVRRFADKATAVNRTWKLLRRYAEAHQEEVEDEAQAEAPKVETVNETATPAPIAAPKAKAEPKAKRVITYARGGVPSTKSYFINAVYVLVTEGVEREALVERVVEEVSPPRSKQYDRNFVLGYLAHMVQKGWLVKTVA